MRRIATAPLRDPLLFSNCAPSVLPPRSSPEQAAGQDRASLGLCGAGNRGAHPVLFRGLPVEGPLFNKDLEQFVAPGT